MGVSLLEKAIGRDRNVHLLDTQYRMHADIMAFPNARFYGGQLMAHESVADATLGRPSAIDFHRYCRQGMGRRAVQSPEADTTGRSHASVCNPEEAGFTVDRVRELLTAQPTATIGVIAPYRAQVTLLEALLHSERIEAEGRLDHPDCGRVPRPRARHHGHRPYPLQ